MFLTEQEQTVSYNCAKCVGDINLQLQNYSLEIKFDLSQKKLTYLMAGAFGFTDEYYKTGPVVF